MTQHLCLIFDENARLRYRIPAGAVSPLTDIMPESILPASFLEEEERQFLGSLRSGDRKNFLRFCGKSLSDKSNSAPCELFPVLGFPPFRYAFCEKNQSGTQILNSVYLAEDIHSFYRMMSPAALQCSRLSDRLIREILLCIGHANPSALSLTSETILAMQYFPTVLRSLMNTNDGRGLCDVERITELVVMKLQETPPFRNTLLVIHHSDCIPALRIIDLSAEGYVHLLMSVLTALLSISADHGICLEVCPFPLLSDGSHVQEPLYVDVKITTGLRDPSEYRNDSGQLQSLTVPGSAAEIMLAAASVLAAAADIVPSYYINYAEQSLQLFLTIHPKLCAEERRKLPEFRYRDPYQSVAPILAEFLDFLETM